MEPARLYESPFIDINDKGPEAIFLPAKVIGDGAGAGGDPAEGGGIVAFNLVWKRMDLDTS